MKRKKKEEKNNITIRLTKYDHFKLKTMAMKKGISMSEMVQNFIRGRE